MFFFFSLLGTSFYWPWGLLAHIDDLLGPLSLSPEHHHFGRPGHCTYLSKMCKYMHIYLEDSSSFTTQKMRAKNNSSLSIKTFFSPENFQNYYKKVWLTNIFLTSMCPPACYQSLVRAQSAEQGGIIAK